MEVHIPVLREEVVEILNPKPGQIFIDANVNGGGHARVIAERVGLKGRVIGMDWDCGLLKESTLRLRSHPSQSYGGQAGQALQLNSGQGIKNIELVCENFANIETVAKKLGLKNIDGILFDLGFSSYHIEKSGRGFSFMRDEPLDMRYNQQHELTAKKIINEWPQDAIANLLREYGEERYAHRIATGIVTARRQKNIHTTAELVGVIRRNVPHAYLKGRLHFATRTFQALRIAVNHELENLTKALEGSLAVLFPGGRIAVISFHSLEDRAVKSFFNEYQKRGAVKIINKKLIRPTIKEIKENPRARSARLRGAEKIQ